MSRTPHAPDPEPQRVAKSASERTGDRSDRFERPPRRGFTLAALRAVVSWRPLTVLAHAGSAGSFLIGVLFLYDAEGPGRPDVQFQLSTPTGQALFGRTTAALAVASVLAAVGAVLLHSRFWSHATVPSAMAIVLTVLAGAFTLAVLSLQYGLAAVGQEGIAPSTTAFHALAVFEHGAADLVGLVGFGLLAAATVITSAILLARQIWRGAAIVGLLASLALPILDVLQAGYAFMALFAAWELLLAAYVAFGRQDRLVML